MPQPSNRLKRAALVGGVVSLSLAGCFWWGPRPESVQRPGPTSQQGNSSIRPSEAQGELVPSPSPEPTPLASPSPQAQDTTPPTLSIELYRHTLWDTDGRWVNVGLQVDAHDDSGCTPTIKVEVFSNVDDEVAGHLGVLSPDAKDFARKTLQLRSEHPHLEHDHAVHAQGESPEGRLYLVLVTACDLAGNTTSACEAVIVPCDAEDEQVLKSKTSALIAAALECKGAPEGFVPIGDGPVLGETP